MAASDMVQQAFPERFAAQRTKIIHMRGPRLFDEGRAESTARNAGPRAERTPINEQRPTAF
ncbi:hypothetical protein Arub01_11850 [Actinomadura rubrobrunea]|uniref:Uncharacterized protein n=1 Tax=Actinomadura rubrobrunea TaxID=115335 RepID=A0A9W6UST0_9ACTN|nr:hypothetical protein [Actinomadura rubrobrunea]GLW62941.1 hypothetical protein Arub01_11850 [Actinomadura rubrobrunea]